MLFVHQLPMAAAMLALSIFTPPAFAQHAHGDDPAPSPYAGFEGRAVAGLSDADIAELRRGGGWGLALPAELNGAPGPAHVLELRDELDLAADQISAIEAIHADMRAEAIDAAEVLIAAEAALSDAFRAAANGVPLPPERLRDLVMAAAEARGVLRLVHLRRHLDTPDLLTPAQVARYNQLRGYAPDPCASVPDGHSPAMWRLHNRCD
jgi:hypothetical protein